MPDITKCKNEQCPLRESCYRFTCKPDPDWQAYTIFEPDKNGECSFFWPVQGT